jgi:DNA gyrase subunit A
MAGISLSSGAQVTFFGAIDLTVKDGEWASVVVTIAGTTSKLPDIQPGTGKVTPYAEYPTKGRATGGVRCHRLLRPEDACRSGRAGPGR